MKIFKRIWYSLLAVLLIISLSMGLANAYGTGSIKSSLNETSLSSVADHVSALSSASNQRNYIGDLLKAANYREATRVENAIDDGSTEVTYMSANENGVPVPMLAFQQQIMDNAAWEAIAEHNGKVAEDYFASVDVEPENIVAYLPGRISKENSGEGRVVLFYVRYNKEFSAMGADIPVAAMLQNAIESVSASYENDILFLFADSKDGDEFGLYNFIKQFNGFYNVVSRIDCAIDLGSLGASGSMNLVKAQGSYGFVSSVNSIAGKGMSSSLISHLYEKSIGKTDSDLFGCAYAKIANANGLNYFGTTTGEEVSDKTIRNYANAVNGLMASLGNYELGTNVTTQQKTLYFNLFGLSMALPYWVSYLFAAMIVILLAATIMFNLKKKAFSFAKVGKGAGVQIISLLCAGAVMFVLYYLMLLLLSLLTLVPVHAIASLRYSGAGIIACMLLLSVPVIIGSQMIFKKLFVCKAADIVRGNVLLLSIIGIVFAFLPDYGFFLSIMAVLELVVMLVSVLCQQKYSDKYNDSLGKLFLYIIPIIILLPVFINKVVAITSYAILIYLPVICMIFAMFMSFVTPYFGMIKPSMQKLVAKLPKRVIRVSKTVTERVEDKAKKGKFTEQTVTKVEKQYVTRKYKNRYAVIALAVIMVIVNLIVGGVGIDFGKNITVEAIGQEPIYKNSMIYYYDVNNDASYFEIYDHLLYRQVNYAVDGFEWDADKQVYLKQTSKLNELLYSEPSISRVEDDVYSVVLGNNRSEVRLEINGISSVTNLTVRSSSGDEFEIALDYKTSIELFIPSGYGNFELVMEGLAAETQLNFSYTESLMIASEDLVSRYSTSSEWEVLSQFENYSETLLPFVKGGFIAQMTKRV